MEGQSSVFFIVGLFLVFSGILSAQESTPSVQDGILTAGQSSSDPKFSPNSDYSNITENEDSKIIVLNNVTESSNVTNITEGSLNVNDSRMEKSGNLSADKGFQIPDIWKDFCHVNYGSTYESKFTKSINLTSISCLVTAQYSEIWNLTDLRELSKQHPDENFSVNLECLDQSSVSVPWPMKVDGLIKFVMKNCRVLDYFKEYDDPVVKETRDSLRVLEIYNSVIVVSLAKFIKRAENISEVSEEVDCGQDKTIEYMANLNQSYELVFDIPVDAIDILETGETFMRSSKRRKHICDFKKLMVLHEGNSQSMSFYESELFVENSIFDELLVYNLTRNGITVLKDSVLQWSLYFPKLQVLDLSYNSISELYKFAVPLSNKSDHITTIDLQFNNITEITVPDLKELQSLRSMFVDVRNNKINCNCSGQLTELVQYIDNESNLGRYGYIRELQCSDPYPLVNRTLGSLAFHEICPKEKEYFIGHIIALSVVVVILAVAVFVLFRYRQEVTILLFTKFNIIIPCQDRVDAADSKKYTAFVSYSSKEGEWVEDVIEELERQSEENHGSTFRFCLHHRDFVPGRTIFDNVIKSVESSHHTIILLSKNFLNSQYCLYEFQEAFRQSIMEQKRHLIIVMMEEIEESLLPRDLKRCLSTFTYIRKDDYLFTERLIFALSVKHKVSQNNKKKKKDKPQNKDKPVSGSPKESQTTKKKNNLNLNIKNENCRNKDIASSFYIPNITNSAKSSPETNSKIHSTKDEIISFENHISETTGESNNIEGIRKAESTAKLVDKAESNFEAVVEVHDNGGRDVTEDTNASPEVLLGDTKMYDRSVSVLSADTGYGSERCTSLESAVSDTMRFKREFSETTNGHLNEVVCIS